MDRLVTKIKCYINPRTKIGGVNLVQSLSVKYRPVTFDDVCAQKSVVLTLQRQIELKQFKNAYLLCGASGCGKTTIARIFANEINNHLGYPIEIDAASNNSVENIRNIVKAAQERSLDSDYKIYIIDECHCLSNQAWQAFLKCIEEPPKYTIFIFCTTDPQKVPATILNRVMKFNISRLPADTIKERLLYICKAEGFYNYEEACDYISRTCNGGMRDAIATLDKCAGYSIDLSLDNILYCLDSQPLDVMFSLINAIIDGNEAQVFSIIDEIYLTGMDLKLFINQFLVFCLDLNKYILFKDLSVTSFPESYLGHVSNAINFNNADKYYGYVTSKLLKLKNSIQNELDLKSSILVGLLEVSRCQ